MHPIAELGLQNLSQPFRNGTQPARPSVTIILAAGTGNALQLGNANCRRGFVTHSTPIRRTVIVPPLSYLFWALLHKIRKWNCKQFVSSFIHVNRKNVFLELLKAIANGGRIRQLIQTFAPSVRNEFSFDNASVPIVNRQRLEADLLGKTVGKLVGSDESGTRGISISLKFHQVSIAAPVRLLLEKQEVVVSQKIGRGQSANTATHNNNVVMRRDRRPSKDLSIAYLMTNMIVFALYLGTLLGRRGKQR